MLWDKKVVTAAMVAKLKDSGIDYQVAVKKLRMCPLTGNEAKTKIPGLSQYRGLIKIPYFNMEGKETNFCRVRYLEEYAGFEKFRKYDQPKGSKGTHIYWVPGCDWKSVAANTEEIVWFTEGEFKAVAGFLNDLAVIGLGGVDSFRGKDTALAEELLKFNWKGRTVFIAYDSDALINPNIVRAENRLADALTAEGALPRIVRLPHVALKGDKTGLDDYLMAKDASSLIHLATTGAEEYEKAAAIHKLAEEVVYIKEPDIVYELATGFKMDSTRFRNSYYANRIHYELVGKSKVPTSTAAAFMKARCRPELRSFTFAPGKELVVGNQANLWRGNPVEAKKGDVSLWHRLMQTLFLGKEKEALHWFERWVAYPLQHPGYKLKTAVLIWGGQGTGKSFAGELISAMYGGLDLYSTEFKNSELSSDYNDWAESKQFAIGEEIVVNTIERNSISEQLKTLITGEKIMIHKKFLNRFPLPNCMNIMVVSNHTVPLKLEADDRRYFVLNVGGGQVPAELYKPLKEFKKNEAGIAALYHYFLTLPLGDFDPDASAYKTADREELIEGGGSALDNWCRQLKTDPDAVLTYNNIALPRYHLYTADDLYKIFSDQQKAADQQVRISVINMSSTLSGTRFTKAYQHPIRLPGLNKSKRLWVIRPIAGKLGPSDMGKLYEDERREVAGKFTKAGHKERTKK